MTRSVRSLALAALLPVVCSCATPSSSRHSARAITLRFAWPENLSARVSYSFAMKSPLGNTEVQRSYWLTVEPATEKGLHRLVPRDIEVSPPELAGLVDPVPTVHFDDEGAFQGVDTPEDLPGQRMLEVLPLEPEKKAEIIQNLVAGQEQAAREFWDRLVAHWPGTILTPGEPVRLETTMVVGTGMMEKQEVAAEERFSIESGVPCSQDEQERRCVRLIVETEPVGQSKEDTGPLARKRFELVTEPATLVPYSTRLMRLDRVDWGKDGGEPSLKEFMQVEQYAFTYGARPVPPGSSPL